MTERVARLLPMPACQQNNFLSEQNPMRSRRRAILIEYTLIAVCRILLIQTLQRLPIRTATDAPCCSLFSSLFFRLCWHCCSVLRQRRSEFGPSNSCFAPDAVILPLLTFVAVDEHSKARGIVSPSSGGGSSALSRREFRRLCLLVGPVSLLWNKLSRNTVAHLLYHLFCYFHHKI